MENRRETSILLMESGHFFISGTIRVSLKGCMKKMASQFSKKTAMPVIDKEVAISFTEWYHNCTHKSFTISKNQHAS